MEAESMPKLGWIGLLILLLVLGNIANGYIMNMDNETIQNQVTVTAPFHPQYISNQEPQSSIDLIKKLCGITQFSQYYGTTGAGQHVALIDSGIDLGHPAFQNDCTDMVKVGIYKDFTNEGLLETQTVLAQDGWITTGGVDYEVGEIVNEAECYRLAILKLDAIRPRIFSENDQQIAILVTAQNGSQYNCVYLDTNQNCSFIDEQPLYQYGECFQSVTLPSFDYSLNLALTSIAPDGSKIQLTADTLGHGTFLAGLVAANGDTYKGVVPQVQLSVYKIFNRDGQSSQQVLANAIRQAVLDGADCINLSLSIPQDEPVEAALEIALQQAYDASIPVVAASGNYGPGKNSMAYPARNETVLGIGSYVHPEMEEVDRDILLKKSYIPDYSGRGQLNGDAAPLIVAPAGGMSTVPSWYADCCLYDYGTSISSAITTAAICHVQEAAEKRGLIFSPNELQNLLAQWAEPMSFSSTEQGYGMLKLKQLPRTAEGIPQRKGFQNETILYKQEDSCIWNFEILQGQSQSWFVQVPAGSSRVSAVFQLDQQLPKNWTEHLVAMGRCRMRLYNPDGILMDQTDYLGASYGNEIITSGDVFAIFPQPGIWEIVITSADNLSQYNHLESIGTLKVDF